VIVLCPVIAPYRSVRDEVRELHGDRFIEVYVSTPIDECAARDVKGLFARQKAGELTGLTGVDDPYEPPLNPEVVVPTHEQSLDESVETVWRALSLS
jgi:adenylylsulfate kinase